MVNRVEVVVPTIGDEIEVTVSVEVMVAAGGLGAVRFTFCPVSGSMIANALLFLSGCTCGNCRKPGCCKGGAVAR